MNEPEIVYDPLFGIGLKFDNGEVRFAPPRIVCMNTLMTALKLPKSNRAERRAAKKEQRHAQSRRRAPSLDVPHRSRT